MRSKFGGWWVASALAAPIVLAQGGSQEAGDSPESIDETVRSHAAGLVRTHARREALIAEDRLPRTAPFFVVRAGGTDAQRPLLGYLEWAPGLGDRIVVGEHSAEGEEAGRRFVDSARDEIVRPVGVVDANGRARIVWTAPVDGVAQLRTAHEKEDGSFAPPVTLTSGPGPNLNAEIALHADGKVWVAWESDADPDPGSTSTRSSRDVFVAPIESGDVAGGGPDRLGARTRIGAGRFSDLDAAIASSGSRLWIAWVAYTSRDYEIRARSFDPAASALSEVVEVSADGPSDDLHPCLAPARNGDVWVAWDRVEIPARGESAPPGLRVRPKPDSLDVSVRVACLRDGRVLIPQSKIEGVADGIVPGAPKLSTGGGTPRLALDGLGRPWIAYRYLEGVYKQYAYVVLVQRLDAAGWSAPIEIDRSGGLPEEPALVPDETGVLVAFGCDRQLEPNSRRLRSTLPELIARPLRELGVRLSVWGGTTGIGLARASAPADESNAAPTLVERTSRIDTPHFHPFEGRLDDPFVTGERHFEIEQGERRYRVYWGDLHRHSSVSRCSKGMEPRPEERWEWGRDVSLYDFMALTDHAGQIQPSTWWQLDKLCWLMQSPSFVTLAGWEWSTVEYGHHNVILPGRMAPLVGDSDSIESLYGRLLPGQCVTIPHHPSDKGFPNDFDVVDDRFTRLIEVYQAMRGNYEFDGCFKQSPMAGALGSFAHDALNQGHEFGIIASTDHGHGQAYACVLSEKLDRASIFAALHARRTYGATTKGVLVDLRVGDALMGERVECKVTPRVRLRVQGAGELAHVVVYRNGKPFQEVGSTSAAAAHDLAPTRLEVRLPARTDAPKSAWWITVRAPQVRFEKLDDKRRFARRRESPTWSFGAEEAKFTWPAGFATAGGAIEYALHARTTVDATFEFRTADAPAPAPAPVTATATFSSLRREPLLLDAPGGKCEISIDVGDGAIDFEKGLGTREFAGEWDDPEARSGSTWYYARVIQTDGEMAWSSPIFVTRP